MNRIKFVVYKEMLWIIVLLILFSRSNVGPTSLSGRGLGRLNPAYKSSLLGL